MSWSEARAAAGVIGVERPQRRIGGLAAAMAGKPDEHADNVQLLDSAIREMAGATGGRLRVLDLGCGAGEVVEQLGRLGYDTFGCDIDYEFTHLHAESDRLRRISMSPYRLPFDDQYFDVVVSNQVMEHVQDKLAVFQEVKRVLRPGGFTVHIFPSKWNLREPHIFVPIAGWFWPKIPKAWFYLWALLGVRNEYQREMSLSKLVSENDRYCRVNLNYQSWPVYQKLLNEVFGNARTLSELYLMHSPGRKAKLLRKLPGAWLTSRALATLDQRVIFARN